MAVFESTYPEIEVSTQTITERVFEGLESSPDRMVLCDGVSGAQLTAAQFMLQVKQLAGGLTARGFGAGHVVAILAPNCPEYCVIFHAVAWAGGTVTTLNPTYTAAEVRHQLNDAKAEILFTLPSLLEVAESAIEGTAVEETVVIGSADNATSIADLMAEPLDEQVAVDVSTHTVVLPYSSGTTGLPKGVKLSHQNLVVNVDQTIAASGFCEGEVAVAFLPFFHIYGMNVLMNMHLARAGALVTLPRFDLPLYLKLCQDHRSRRLWIVPPVALALAKHPLIDNYDLSSVEQVFSGAAPLGAELSDEVAVRLNCQSVQGYGMTELSPVSHASSNESAKAGASGLALPSTQCRIVDTETGADLAAGEAGELWIKGPQVMQGYLNNLEATAESISSDGWLHTGDIAVIDDEGYMTVVDRLKELIKYKGFQVAPAELEALLVAHAAIADAAVIGLADQEAGELPVAFVVAGEQAPSESEIKHYIADNLAHYKQIHRVYFVSEIPKSASGKILRRLLRDKLNA